MAVYQFNIDLIPKVWVEKNGDAGVNTLTDDDEIDQSIAWKEHSLPVGYEMLMSSVLPRGKSWSEDLQVWGAAENSDIQVWVENGCVDSIQVRLDLRNLTKDLKSKVVNLANQLNCYFRIVEERKIISPTIDVLNKLISDSNAAQFVADPKSFLDKIRKDNIIVFDGVCNLCNAGINFTLKKDRKNMFKFAMIQSKTGRKLLADHGISINNPETFLFIKRSRAYFKSDAAIAIASELPMLWKILIILRIVPRFIRDKAYSVIARNRYKWFRKRDQCMVPSQEQRNKFFD